MGESHRTGLGFVMVVVVDSGDTVLLDMASFGVEAADAVTLRMAGCSSGLKFHTVRIAVVRKALAPREA